MDRHLVSTSFWEGGPTPGGFYPTQSHEEMAAYMHDNGPSDPRKHTLQPIVTGTSVLGLKFNGGVVIAADTLGSYGSLARFRTITRLTTVGNNTVVGASGDIGDFQQVKYILEEEIVSNQNNEDGHVLSPKSVHSMLTRNLYHHRSKMSPLWTTLVVAGFHKGESYLGFVDKLGVAYEDATIATGYGLHIARPLLRSAVERNADMSQEDAVKTIKECLKVLFYRDARSFNRYEVAVITADGVTISAPESAETNWEISSMVKGYE